MNIDRTTNWSLQMEIFQHFLRFQANLRAWFSSPLKEGSSLMSGSIINSSPLKEGLSVMRGSTVVSSPLKEGLSLLKGSTVVSSPLKEGLSLGKGSTVNSVTWFSMCRNCIQRTWRVQWRPTSTVFWHLWGQSLSPQKWRRWSPKLTPLKKRVSLLLSCRAIGTVTGTVIKYVQLIKGSSYSGAISFTLVLWIQVLFLSMYFNPHPALNTSHDVLGKVCSIFGVPIRWSHCPSWESLDLQVVFIPTTTKFGEHFRIAVLVCVGVFGRYPLNSSVFYGQTWCGGTSSIARVSWEKIGLISSRSRSHGLISSRSRSHGLISSRSTSQWWLL